MKIAKETNKISEALEQAQNRGIETGNWAQGTVHVKVQFVTNFLTSRNFEQKKSPETGDVMGSHMTRPSPASRNDISIFAVSGA